MNEDFELLPKPTVIEGWNHDRAEYLNAHLQDGLLKIVVDTSARCNLSCPACFAVHEDDERAEHYKPARQGEMKTDSYISLLHEAHKLGAQTVDIVGAGEPTMPGNRALMDSIVAEAKTLGMTVVVFTHGATRIFQDKKELAKYKDAPISFFIKLWSLDSAKMNKYVRAKPGMDYTTQRDIAIKHLEELGFMQGTEQTVDGHPYQTTRVAADILVMKSNLEEIPDIFRFCRQHGIMPLIKTYIPQGSTKLDHERGTFAKLSANEQAWLKSDEVTPAEFDALRSKLAEIDKDEFGVTVPPVIYPQATFCTQSAGALYVTSVGEVYSCVGTGYGFGLYQSGQDMLATAVRARRHTEDVGVGCVPRITAAHDRGHDIPAHEFDILSQGRHSRE